MKRICWLNFVLMLLVGSRSWAFSQCAIHTWHPIYSNKGEWQVTLKVINQNGYFVDKACQPIETGHTRPDTPMTYGFGFSLDATFDIAYTVTAVKQDTQAFESPVCVFVVSASGPAEPDVTALSYHGAQCEWKKVARTGGAIYLS
ncbi:hypothetical protein [Legionella sp. W05-934-2]|jgi:hypothetical protein|uniref:hypothetical protein n=1 Tax=Legionella sp. W05-934-2 TaxID=1198649 RepID=UPI0034633C7C